MEEKIGILEGKREEDREHFRNKKEENQASATYTTSLLNGETSNERQDLSGNELKPTRKVVLSLSLKFTPKDK